VALVAARAVQAVGGAALLPSTLAIIASTFPDPKERAQAIGLWSGVSGMALAAGPVLGGLLVDSFGWRSVFYVNLPVGVAAMLVAGRAIAESRNPRARPLDLPGLLLGIAALGSLTYALVEGNPRGWGSPLIVGLLAVAGVALAAFLAVESRRAEPMLALRFFRDASFSSANTVALLVGFALLGFMFFNTLYFQTVQGYSPLQAGLRSLPNTLAVVVMAPLAGRLASRFGYRVPVVAGTLLAGTALLELLRIQVDTPYADLWWNFVLLGAGLGLTISPVVTARFAAVLPARLTPLGLPGPGGGWRRRGPPRRARGVRHRDPRRLLLAGIALLCGSLVALVFLRGDRAAGPSAPAGVAPAGVPARADERP
jgi:EmrB/QacA subfamily drug resistance transporter